MTTSRMYNNYQWMNLSL